MGNLPSHYAVLKVEPKDAALLSEISYKAKAHWGYPEEWMERWADDLTVKSEYIEKNDVFKLNFKGDIIGFCALTVYEDHYEISHLWILPEYMGKGLGAFLLNESLNIVAQLPIPIRVLSDPNARAFYEKQGFKVVSWEESFPPGRFLPVLERLL